MHKISKQKQSHEVLEKNRGIVGESCSVVSTIWRMHAIDFQTEKLTVIFGLHETIFRNSIQRECTSHRFRHT